MRLVFFGTGAFGEPGLRGLCAAGHEIVGVISQPDRPSGRGHKVLPTPIHAAADALGLSHRQCEDVNAIAAAELAAGAALGVVVAFGQKLGPALLAAFSHGCINLHASLLPRYRGAAPIQRAVMEGAGVTGVTVFQLNEKWDAGAILGHASTPIGAQETADELHDRLAGIGGTLLVDVVARIAAGTAQPSTQDASQATRAPKLSKAEGTVDWTAPATAIVPRIHGLWSWPAAASTFVSRRGTSERLQIARAAITDTEAPPTAAAPPGAFHADRTVQTGRGRVQLLEVRPAGKALMSFDAFANGRAVGAGDRLEPVPTP